MLTKPVAGAFDLDDDGMMQEPIQKRGRNNGITEDLAPFCEAAVRGKE